MILYIGWTNLMLLNIHRIQTTLNKDKESILVIIDNGVMNSQIIYLLKESNIFYEIFIIPVVWFTASFKSIRKNLKKLPNILTYSIHIKSYYRIILENQVYNNEFECAFVPGFGYNILLILDVISENNIIDKIKIYESGTTQYACSLSDITEDLEHGSRTEKYIRKLNEYRLRKKFRKLINKELYVYEPKCIKETIDVKAIQIPKYETAINTTENLLSYISMNEELDNAQQIPEKNHFIDILYSIIPEMVRIALKKRSILFLVSYGASLNEELQLFMSLLSEENHRNVYLKIHSQAPSLHKKLQEKFGKLYFTDTNNYLLEAAFRRLDLSRKIIISRYSSAGLTPKFMFGQEPVIIFIYKLFSEYEYVTEDPFGEVIKKIKAQYSDPTRVMVPATQLEFKIMLYKAKKMINKDEQFQNDTADADDGFLDHLPSEIGKLTIVEELDLEDIDRETLPSFFDDRGDDISVLSIAGENNELTGLIEPRPTYDDMDDNA